MYFTKASYLIASVTVGCWVAALANPAQFEAPQEDQSADQEERLLLLTMCTGSSGTNGWCRWDDDCRSRKGEIDGRCDFLGFKACCIDVAHESCDSSSSSARIRFQNPSYPDADTTGSGDCSLAVQVRRDVCQLRLDFTEFSLAQPDFEGVCDTDKFSVTGGNSVPEICGENGGQHMYVNVAAGDTVDLNVLRGSMDVKFNILVSQITCDSDNLVPPACLQYFTENSGTIMSFNYGSSTFGTHQLADQSYSICIESQDKDCEVTYTQSPGSDFAVSLDPGSLPPHLAKIPKVDGDCETDYLRISGSTILENSNFMEPAPTTADRYCGITFPGARVAAVEGAPYTIEFRSDGDETQSGDLDNDGFKLDYWLNTRC